MAQQINAIVMILMITMATHYGGVMAQLKPVYTCLTLWETVRKSACATNQTCSVGSLIDEKMVNACNICDKELEAARKLACDSNMSDSYFTRIQICAEGLNKAHQTLIKCVQASVANITGTTP